MPSKYALSETWGQEHSRAQWEKVSTDVSRCEMCGASKCAEDHDDTRDAVKAIAQLGAMAWKAPARLMALLLRMGKQDATLSQIAVKIIRAGNKDKITRQAVRDLLKAASRDIPSLAPMLMPRTGGMFASRRAGPGGRPSHKATSYRKTCVQCGKPFTSQAPGAKSCLRCRGYLPSFTEGDL